MAIEDFGVRMKNVREEKDLSQASLGKLVGVSATTISNYEANKIHPSLTTFTKLIKILNVSADYILGIDPPFAECDDLDLTDSQILYIDKLTQSLKEKFRKANASEHRK